MGTAHATANVISRLPRPRGREGWRMRWRSDSFQSSQRSWRQQSSPPRHTRHLPLAIRDPCRET